MSRRGAALVLAACVLAPVLASAQGPWNVVVTPTMNPLPVGFCAAIHLNVFDPAVKEAPRNPLGHRVTIADFDIAVPTPVAAAAVTQQTDASHWSACACQGASPGSSQP